MRKIYALLLFTIISGTSNAQLVNLNGNVQIYTSAGSIFYLNGDIHINGTSSFTNNGQFESTGQLELNNSSLFLNSGAGNARVNSFNLNSGTLTNQSSDSFNVNNNADLGGGLVSNTSSILTVGGNTNMNVGTVTNTGIYRTNSLNTNPAAVFSNDNGVLQLENSFNPTAASNLDTDLGTIEFVGNDATKTLNIGGIVPTLDVRKIVFNAGLNTNDIILESAVHISDTADFNSGIVQYANSATDSLVVLSGGLVTMDSVGGNGLMADALYRYPNSVGEFMRFPVGDATGKYRPLWVNSAQYTGAPPKIAVSYLGNKIISDTNAVGYNTTYNTNSWGLYEVQGNFDSSIVQVQYGAGDGVTPVESIIAQGFTIAAGDTIYFNLGQGSNAINALGGIVTSKIPANGDNSVIMIGQSTELRVRVRAYLEGAQNSLGGAVFDTDILSTGQLASIFEFTGTTSQPMLPGKTIPNAPVGAVDSIRLILRDVGNNDVDTTSAWLMADGSIRDYLTGELNYAVFSSAPNGPAYFVVMDHRNHLKVRSTSTVVPTNTGAGVLVDFTDPTQIFGAGGIKLISPASAMIAGGNSNGDAAVNAIDYVQVGNSNFNSDSGYLNTNVLFNNGNAANVDAADFSKTQNNSQVIYFSTAQ